MKMDLAYKQRTMCLTLFENLDFLGQNTNRVYFKYDWSF